MLSLVFFIFSSILAFLVAFGIEDAVINQQLAQLSNKNTDQSSLPANVRLVDSLAVFGLDSSNVEPVGELKFQGTTFHYLQQGEKYLVMELLSGSVIQRGLKEILLFIIASLIPCFILTYFISKWVANLALEPYERMNTQLTLNSDSILKPEFVEQFKETDIRNICITLQGAIQAKYLLLEKQEEFNKGMSHELRTPLQVMTLATESLSQKVVGLSDNESFKRIERSIDRINRTSSALLWLNSSKVCATKTSAKDCIEKCNKELMTLLSNNNLSLSIDYWGDFTPTIPSEVLELVLISLIQNAINHGDFSNQRYVKIVLYDYSLEISNPVCTVNDSRTNDNFGIGLPMITSLLDKFMLTLLKKNSDTAYNVTILANYW